MLEKGLFTFTLLLFLSFNGLSYAQRKIVVEDDKIESLEANANEGETILTWCTTTKAEQYKCMNLSMVIERDRAEFKNDYMHLGCKQASDTDECMSWVDSGISSLLALDAGDVHVAGRYHSLVPILQEVYEGGFSFQYSVAVIKKGGLPDINTGTGLHALRGVKACFPSVGSMAGWVLPIHTLMKEGGLAILDCNNHIKSAIGYFGDSCAINSLIDMYNPIGDNSDKLCKLCSGGAGVRCTPGDPYAGYSGALQCLLEAGEVAFLRHTTVPRALQTHTMFVGVTADNFELLCRDGSRRPLQDWLNCHWGRAPADAIVTSSARDQTHRNRYQRYVQKILHLYGEPNKINQTFSGRSNPTEYGGRDQYGNPLVASTEYPGQTPYGARDPLENEYGGRGWDDNYLNNRRNQVTTSSTENPNGQRIETFRLFDSIRHGTTDLMLQDATVSLRSLTETEQASSWVLGSGNAGSRAMEAIQGIRACPVRRATLCLTSDAEMDKCVKMRVALKAALLSPELVCWRGHSVRVCEGAVATGQADFVVVDAADMLHAAAHHKLVPFMTEIYADGQSSYYAVAVAKEQDPDTDLTYLRGKNTCHTGISMAAGWIYPLAYLISNGWIRSYGCDGARAASEYFTKSCAPGSLSSEYIEAGTGAPRDNLCHLCHGASFRRCKRDHSEDYYGHIGALRCLVEGGGDVAFVRHSAPTEISGGRRREWWSRNLLYDDLQLLCPSGTRAKIHDYKNCNLGMVPGSVLMGRPNHTELDAYSDLMLYAQALYGPKTTDDFSFSMFFSPSPYSDLIFSDSAVRLKSFPHSRRSAALVAGPALTRANSLVSCDAPAAASLTAADPNFLSGAPALTVGLSLWLCLALLAIVGHRWPHLQ